MAKMSAHRDGSLEDSRRSGAGGRKRGEDSRQRLKAVLCAAEERLRLAVQGSLITLWECDRDQRVTYIYNPQPPVADAARILGKCGEEILPFEAIREFHEINQRVLASGVGERREVHLAAPDQEYLFDFASEPMRDAAGAVIGLRGLVVNVTERRRFEDSLRSAQDVFKLVHSVGKVGHREWNFVTGENYWSPEIESLYGLPPGGFQGDYDGWLKLIHPDDRSKAETYVRQAMESGRHFTEFRVVWPDGSVHWLEAWARVCKDEQGKPLRLVGVNMDVTERKRIEEELRLAHAELEQRVRERTAELSRLVAELQAEAARRNEAERALRERSEQLRALAGELTSAEQRERKRLAKIIHDHLQQLLVSARFRVLALSRAAGPASAEAAERIDQLLGECVNISRSLTVELSPPVLHEAGLVDALHWLADWMREHHGLGVRFHCDGVLPALDEQTKLVLFEAARELLLNVVKHGRTESARLELQATAAGALRLAVSDDGAGFDPRAAKPPGAAGGFGLFSMRERMEPMGGRLEIHSAVGQGSRITLVIPIQAGADDGHIPDQAAANVASAAVAPSSDGCIRVLIADDHAVMREGLVMLLQSHGGIDIVGQAVDGEDAIHLARSYRPDIVLMDVSMPRLNGIEATRVIRAELPGTKIIGLSMFEESERAQVMLDAGAVAYLSKSRAANDLVTMIRALGAKEDK